MDYIIEILRTRIKILQEIITKSTKYLDIIREIILKINNSEYEVMLSDIRFIESFIIFIGEIQPPPQSLTLSMEIYEQLAKIDNAIDHIITVINNPTYVKFAIYNMSATYMTNIHRDKNAILTDIEKYRDKEVCDDQIIFDKIFGLIDFTAPDNVYLFIVQHENIINRFMIKLIGKAILSLNGERRRRLELIVEKQKDSLLGSSRIDISRWAGVQGILVRYGLTPITSSISREQIFDSLGSKYNAKLSSEDNFKILAAQGTGVIIINRTSTSPIEFDLRGLIDLDYIAKNNLKTNPMNGLNKKIIDRFNTAKLLPSAASSPDVIRKYPGGDYWHILETINGCGLYRLLGKNGNGRVPSDQIIGLLNGVTTRCHQYNLLQSREILNKYYDDKAMMILRAYEEEKILLPSAEPIKTAINDKLSQMFERYMDDNPIKTIKQLKSNSINKSAITEILLGELTHLSGVHSKGSAEYTITYLVKFDSIINLFIKELERRWSDVSITERIFLEHSDDELRSVIMTTFKNVLTAAIDELDRSKLWTEYDISLKEFFLNKKHAIV